MTASDPEFTHTDQHRAWLQAHSALPAGFSVASQALTFTPRETGVAARCQLSLLRVDEPSPAFAGVYTRNAFPGAPVIIGRECLAAERIAAVVINNKISNVCAPDGVQASRQVAAAAAAALQVPAEWVIPSSTGVIGWRLPAEELCAALPATVANLQADSMLPLAEGIVTTDLYPKLRRYDLPGGGSMVGVAKGAGMIEPNLATMLVFIITDCAVSREALRGLLRESVDDSFNAISIDSDQSTSDTVLAISSGRVPVADTAQFAEGFHQLCRELAEDVVRNGEGVRHVQQVQVCGAPNAAIAKGVGKSVINSPLWKTALAGNDPNVGRLLMAIGKYLGNEHAELPVSALQISLGNELIFANGAFVLDPEREQRLQQLLIQAQLYPAGAPDAEGGCKPPVDFPPHGRVVPITIDLGLGSASFRVLGNDLTHEYVSENADYRS